MPVWRTTLTPFKRDRLTSQILRVFAVALVATRARLQQVFSAHGTTLRGPTLGPVTHFLRWTQSKKKNTKNGVQFLWFHNILFECSFWMVVVVLLMSSHNCQRNTYLPVFYVSLCQVSINNFFGMLGWQKSPKMVPFFQISSPSRS